jgi:hypothetical protein
MTSLEDRRRLLTGELAGVLKGELDYPNWTTSIDGRENGSERFRQLADEVAKLIRQNGGQCLDGGWVRVTAGLIVAQLAHVHGLAPADGRLEYGGD